MRLSRPLALAGAAALVAGLGVAVSAETPRVHVMRVVLPDGSMRLVRYTGDTPPRLVVVPGASAIESPFAQLDRMAAMMDFQAAQMMRQIAALSARPAAVAPTASPVPASPVGNVQLAALANAPAGARYSYTTTTVVNGRVCTTSVQATSLGAGKQPQLLRRVSGDGCGSAAVRATGPAPAALAATPTPPRPPRIVSPPAAPQVPAAPKVPADTI